MANRPIVSRSAMFSAFRTSKRGETSGRGIGVVLTRLGYFPTTLRVGGFIECLRPTPIRARQEGEVYHAENGSMSGARRGSGYSLLAHTMSVYSRRPWSLRAAGRFWIHAKRVFIVTAPVCPLPASAAIQKGVGPETTLGRYGDTSRGVRSSHGHLTYVGAAYRGPRACTSGYKEDDVTVSPDQSHGRMHMSHSSAGFGVILGVSVLQNVGVSGSSREGGRVCLGMRASGATFCDGRSGLWAIKTDPGPSFPPQHEERTTGGYSPRTIFDAASRHDETKRPSPFACPLSYSTINIIQPWSEARAGVRLRLCGDQLVLASAFSNGAGAWKRSPHQLRLGRSLDDGMQLEQMSLSWMSPIAYGMAPLPWLLVHSESFLLSVMLRASQLAIRTIDDLSASVMASPAAGAASYPTTNPFVRMKQKSQYFTKGGVTRRDMSHSELDFNFLPPPPSMIS
ncbi:hypothetical protein R3P38DRAFT_2809465 [Favolaschia claudopus]|uniref:Uncharacterized protein n=1 Tax=Favolaschia claudopus TaxID=2862362 RepID=A0AAV9ZCV0_9AGAR